MVLRTNEKALKEKKDRRWRLEHAQVIDLLDFDHFKSAILTSKQPINVTSDM